MMMITTDDIEKSPDHYIFVFGDNLQRVGKGGQAATARDFVRCGKAFGVPTKRKPMSTNDAYFSDKPDEMAAVADAFSELARLVKKGKYIVFFPGIGDGYAKLSEKSPKIHGMIHETIRAFCHCGKGEVRRG